MTLRLERGTRQQDAGGAADAEPPQPARRPPILLESIASAHRSHDEAALPARAGGWTRIALGCAATVFVLEACRAFLLPLVLALVLAFLLSPLVRRCARARLPAPVGAGIVLAGAMGVLLVACMLAAAPARSMWMRVPQAQAKLLQVERALFDAPRASAAGSAAGLAALAPSDSDDALVRAGRAIATDWQRGLPRRAGSAAVTAAATLFLLYFLLASEHVLVTRCLQACGTRRRRARLLAALRRVQREIRAFLLTMAATSLLLGLATGAALAAIGLPDAALCGALTAVITLVPYVGPALVTAGLLLAGSMAYGAEVRLLLPAGIFLGLHFLEGNLLSPWLMGARLRMRPVLVFLAVLAASALWGLAGGFVAVPVLIAIRAAGLCSRRSRLVRLLMQDGAPLPSWRALLARAPRGRDDPV